MLASAGDGMVLLWEPDTQNHIRIFTHQSGDSLAYSPDGNTIAVGGWRRIDLLNARTGEFKATLSGGRASVDLLAFSADSNTLASATRGWSRRDDSFMERPHGSSEAEAFGTYRIDPFSSVLAHAKRPYQWQL